MHSLVAWDGSGADKPLFPDLANIQEIWAIWYGMDDGSRTSVWNYLSLDFSRPFNLLPVEFT